MNKRRFPPPWTIEDMNDACFIVREKNGQQRPGAPAASVTDIPRHF